MEAMEEKHKMVPYSWCGVICASMVVYFTCCWNWDAVMRADMNVVPIQETTVDILAKNVVLLLLFCDKSDC